MCERFNVLKTIIRTPLRIIFQFKFVANVCEKDHIYTYMYSMSICNFNMRFLT